MAAIGQILACPKCGSMVQIQPPPGWQPPAQVPRPLTTTRPAAEGQSHQAADSGAHADPALAATVAAGMDLSSDEAARLAVDPVGGSKWMRPIVVALSTAALLLIAIVTVVAFGSASEHREIAAAAAAASEVGSAELPPAGDDTDIANSRGEIPAEPQTDDVDVAQAASAEPASAVPEMDSASLPQEPATRSDRNANKVDALSEATTESIREPAAGADEQGSVTSVDSALSEPVETRAAANATERPTPPALKRTTPPQIDVQARLNAPVVAIEFAKTTLGRFVEMLSRMSMIPMTFDADALATMNISTDAEISVSLTDTTVGKALNHVLVAHKLGYVVKEHQILITYPQSTTAALRRVRYDVSDLLRVSRMQGGDIQQFAQLVQQFVVPESWSGQGGNGTIATDDNAFLVEQGDREHWEVFALCERLRLARELPLRGSIDDERISLSTRRARATAMLIKPVRLNFVKPAPLNEIAERLGRSVRAQILLDGPALAAAGLALNTDAQLAVSGGPLSSALSQLSIPLGLTVRLVASDTLQITSVEAVAKKLELEFHPVDDLLSPTNPGDRIASRIKERLAASSWTDGGGRGTIHFDEPSDHLLVLQSQDVQIRIEKLLSEWRAAGQVASR